MLDAPSIVRTFLFDEFSVQLLLPVPDIFRDRFEMKKILKEDVPFPYWARLWPSAVAMCRFLAANRTLLKNKKVLELASGLGLPGLMAAQIAAEVVVSDYDPNAVEMMNSSITANALSNIDARQLDWHHLPENLGPDVLLLSDINYNPTAFETIYHVLTGFLEKGVIIVLTTPQRLLARPFIERLLPWVIQRDELLIELDAEQTYISIFVMAKSNTDLSE